ncbi:hypothetical protein Plim_0687 [Planctopirus limnophila DSM 3776]|uniref:Uncharacterized protein n=1 Tax=Planctopirus limnophila (strain ATCC 43296 / DSM 3776 / IFAM 1008 / Mu 290) TaxID=521674 RepID=D5SR66_PLAL2|nr:hypothetical protein Plim_0687 [Planctopirus limnophila DSM 3776]
MPGPRGKTGLPSIPTLNSHEIRTHPDFCLSAARSAAENSASLHQSGDFSTTSSLRGCGDCDRYAGHKDRKRILADFTGEFPG